jgi:hypothetical protein
METKKRADILFAGIILGFLGIVYNIISFSIFMFYEIKMIDGKTFFKFFSETVIYWDISKIFILYIIINSSFLILAIFFNLFGWIKNDRKKILVSSILYIISSSIPSAVLGFIGYYELKKLNNNS